MQNLETPLEVGKGNLDSNMISIYDSKMTPQIITKKKKNNKNDVIEKKKKIKLVLYVDQHFSVLNKNLTNYLQIE